MHDHDDDLTRRAFLKLLGASIALAGLDGCTRIPGEKILPYVTQPPELTPGSPLHYATSMVLDGYATGLVVESHEGRPTKVEGNPDHPASLGAAGILEQASVLQLYDPDRARAVRYGNATSTWQAFAAAVTPAALRQRVGARGAGLALLLEPTSSPLIASTLLRLQALYPDVRVYYYAPLAADAQAIPQYDIAGADVILSVGSDFLASGPFTLRYAREFADRRRAPLSGMNRLYVAEPGFTVTGAAADHRLRCRPTEIEPLLESLRGALDGHAPGSAWIAAAAADLHAHAGKSLVIAGDRISPRARAVAAEINDTLGNTGRTVWYARSPLLGSGDPNATLASLAHALGAGSVDTLVCIGGNSAYATPAGMKLGELMGRARTVVYSGLYENETARRAAWFVPAAHYLETWGDARAYDGTYSVIQPLVQPLFGGKSIIEVLAALAGDAAADPLAMLRASAKAGGMATDDESWASIVRRGLAASAPLERVAMPPRTEPPASIAREPGAVNTIEVEFAPDSRVHDGSFSNNGWLQELPDPVTKLTWDNAALVSPATAERIGAATGDIIRLAHDSVALQIPALVVPGQPDGVATLHFGFGRAGAEKVASGIGADAYLLWPATDVFHLSGVSAQRADAPARALAITQTHWTMEGRDQARSETLEQYRAESAKPPVRQHQPLTIYDPQQRLDSPLQWAMTIDLATCTGCSACVVACQAENNTPVVGRDDVVKSREMHWLRIDRYLEGGGDDPQVITQPMLCQQCENAPCEYVCPVGATVHSPDGLNEMVYNRCVGTRFCSNNCPYKVRRFNWFDYNANLSETEQMVKNPDVTVRERGVMEKCTFCVQRIREAEISAGIAGRPLRGDEVKTACQQACPTNAIVFGSLTEADSEMMRRRSEPRAYGVLEQLGTQPRVRYLARVRNPNPALESGG
jgi:Fe-S-cluster-containing dehydrogenase component/anaerobic selenocysteine-containing dehydrogenase